MSEKIMSGHSSAGNSYIRSCRSITLTSHKQKSMRHTAWFLTVAFVLGSITAHSARGQGFEGRQSRAGLTIGLGGSGGATIIVDAPDLQKISPAFAWRGEVSATYPLTPVIGANLVFGIEGRGVKTYYFDNSMLSTDWKVNYFSLYPSFTFSGFNLGVNFGVPLGATATPYTGITADIADDRVPTMIEPRAGGVIPLVDDKIGWLSLTLLAGYSLTELIEPTVSELNTGNWKNASLQLGVRFEFGIPGTERQDGE